MERNSTKKRKTLQELTLLDRFLFDKAVEDAEICRKILGIIMEKDDFPEVTIGISEKTIEAFYDSRAVRLDLLAFTESDGVYNAEAQRKDKGYRYSVRRSRNYQAFVDVNLLEPGEVDFGKMQDSYTIFISPYDLFHQGKYKYTFRMKCDECPDLVLDDGAVRMFLCTKGTNDEDVSKELVEFLHCMDKADFDIADVIK